MRARRQGRVSRPQLLGLVVALVVVGLVPVLAVPASAVPSLAAKAPSCHGLRHQVGLTKRTLTIANVSDLSGPVPGLHRDAALAVRAYLASFNATSSICGRKLRLLSLDSAYDAPSGQAGYLRACRQAFAAVGSVAALDDGGAAQAKACGLPDLRAQLSSAQRSACPTCFATQATKPQAVPNAIPDFLVQQYPAAAQNAAVLYLNVGAYPARAARMVAADRQRGVNTVYTSPIDLAEFNYGPYVQQMKTHGVRVVQFLGAPQSAARLAQAMHDAGFAPDVFLAEPGTYSRTYPGYGAATDGTVVAIGSVPLEQAASNAELHRYKHWLEQVAPGTAPTYDGLYAWSAARLFTERAKALGGRLTRARLVTALRRVHGWTDHGAHPAQDIGRKQNQGCVRFLRLVGTQWTPVGGTSYRCAGSTLVP